MMSSQNKNNPNCTSLHRDYIILACNMLVVALFVCPVQRPTSCEGVSEGIRQDAGPPKLFYPDFCSLLHPVSCRRSAIPSSTIFPASYLKFIHIACCFLFKIYSSKGTWILFNSYITIYEILKISLA